MYIITYILNNRIDTFKCEDYRKKSNELIAYGAKIINVKDITGRVLPV